jgi:hypothetical protein
MDDVVLKFTTEIVVSCDQAQSIANSFCEGDNFEKFNVMVAAQDNPGRNFLVRSSSHYEDDPIKSISTTVSAEFKSKS